MEQQSEPTSKTGVVAPSALAVTYATVGCVAIWLWVLIPGQVGTPVTLFGAAPEGLSPDLMPQAILLGIIALSVIGFWQAYRNSGIAPARPGLPVFVTCATSFAFAGLLVPLGFVVASAVTVVSVALFLGGRSLLALACTGLVVPITIYLIFTRVLHISLPQGVVGF